MQADSPQPSLAQDLVRIHKVITRGITVGVTRGTKFIQDGFPDRNLQQGFADYVRSLGSVLEAHHLSEDEIAFPALRELLSSAPYDRLAEDHKKIEAALGPMMDSLPVVAGAEPAAGLDSMMVSLKRISAVWTQHYKTEERFFSPTALAGVMKPDEQARVSLSMGKLSQERAGPPFLVLPFMLFNLAGANRLAMAESLPKAVKELIVSKDWSERWAPMKPFLLD
jgi:hypothetical protein